MDTTALFFLLLFFFLHSSLSEDTVAKNTGTRQLLRLVDLLTPQECEEVLLDLSRPEEDIFRQLERLSAQNNPLKVPRRTRRDKEKEIHCRPALIDWLRIHGKDMYYQRLFPALQHVGRNDIAIEMIKNINQDINLDMQRYVEDYHQQVIRMASHLEPTEK